MESKLISILIACYNGEKYIDKCLKSCTTQSYKNIEILVINDGSNDKSLNILNKWKKKDNRIRIISQNNKGLGETRNILVSNANGVYFTFVDIDDYIPIEAIELLSNKAFNLDYDIVTGRTILDYQNKKIKIPFIPTWIRHSSFESGHYVKSNICTPWASLIKTEYFKSLKISFLKDRVFEDYGVMPYVFLKTNKFCMIKNIVYYYVKYKPTDEETSLSNFYCDVKIKTSDWYDQANQLFSWFEKEEWFGNKKYRRWINGLIILVLMAIYYLLNHENKTNKYSLEFVKYNFTQLIYSYNMRVKISKTIWKFFSYFFIISNFSKTYKKIISTRKNINKEILDFENDIEFIIRNPNKKIIDTRDNFFINELSNKDLENKNISIILTYDFFNKNQKLIERINPEFLFIDVEGDFNEKKLKNIMSLSYNTALVVNKVNDSIHLDQVFRYFYIVFFDFKNEDDLEKSNIFSKIKVSNRKIMSIGYESAIDINSENREQVDIIVRNKIEKYNE